MIYITIPEGWEFIKGSLEEGTFDCLINRQDQTKQINLQIIIKESLRQKIRKAESIVVNDQHFAMHGAKLTIYFKNLPYNPGIFLKYVPQNNGRYPAEYTEMILSNENSLSRNTPSPRVNFGMRWFDNPAQQERLSIARLEEVRKKALEQQENRRHVGDSPMPT